MVEFTGEVHPFADRFPMLPEDEAAELADDIAENGLTTPIVLDRDGRLIDGRNRLRACERAGVEPQFRILENGTNPVAFILSANIRRRHLNAGQRAMLTAEVYPEPAPVGRGKKVDAVNLFDKAYLSRARFVLRYAPHLVEAVIAGDMTLNAAHEQAELQQGRRFTEQETREELQRDAPDLAAQVVEGTLTLTEAAAALRQRREDHVGRIRRSRARLDQWFIGWHEVETLSSNPDRDEILAEYDDESRERIEQCIELAKGER